MSRDQKLKDNLIPLNRGMVSAIRKRAYFDTLDEIASAMSPIIWDLYPGEPRRDSAFFDKVFDSAAIGRNFRRIQTMYEKGLLPVRLIPAVDDPSSQEAVETAQLEAVASVAYPPPEGVNEDLLRFIKFFRSRPAASSDSDFTECREMLEVACLKIAGMRSPRDQELYERDPKKSLEAIEDRVKKIKNVFARGASQFLSSVSDELKAALFDPNKAARVPFYAGDGSDSLDSVLGGFHGSGLVTLLGGTSGGKTLAKSSIAANHCYRAFVEGRPPPTIWGYIGEDSTESYTMRMLVNIMNREPLRQELGIGGFDIGEWSEVCGDPGFVETASEVCDAMMGGCWWLRAPDGIEEKINFSTESMLEAFDAKLDAGAPRPDFIIVDYFNLLKLSKRNSTSNRAFDLQQLSHYLDEWAAGRNLCILTAVQAGISGIIGARDMRFFEQEDLHESKSIAHNSRMVISLMPFKQYNREDGSARDWMGLKVLKNRGGPRDLIFVSDLDLGKNQTMTDSRLMTDVEWAEYRNDLLATKSELFAEDDLKDGGGFKKGRTARGDGAKKRDGAKKGGKKPATTPGSDPKDHGDI